MVRARVNIVPNCGLSGRLSALLSGSDGLQVITVSVAGCLLR